MPLGPRQERKFKTLVSLTLARGKVPVVTSLRLFLPKSWTSNPDRLAKARVPDDHRAFRRKTAIAIEEVDLVRSAGVRFGCVLADTCYGSSARFRQALSEIGLAWTVGTPRHQKVYPADVTLVFPAAARGRKRLHRIPDARSAAAHSVRRRDLADGQLAPRHQGAACGPVRGAARAGSRCPDTADW